MLQGVASLRMAVLFKLAQAVLHTKSSADDKLPRFRVSVCATPVVAGTIINAIERHVFGQRIEPSEIAAELPASSRPIRFITQGGTLALGFRGGDTPQGMRRVLAGA